MEQIKAKNIMRKYITIYYVLISILSLISVLLHIIYSKNPLVTMVKFTIHSNVLAGIVFLINIILIVHNRVDMKWLRILKDASLMYLIVVCLSYHFILTRGNTVYYGPRVYTNIILHYIIPVLVLINWIFFEQKKTYNYKTLIFWLAFPVLYCIISLLRGAFDGFYPYFFLNPNGNIPVGIGSYFNVAIAIIIFCITFAFLGLLLIFIGNKVVDLKKRQIL